MCILSVYALLTVVGYYDLSMADPDRINRHDSQQQEGVVHDTQAL